jgi:circadian clock protein KaiC
MESAGLQMNAIGDKLIRITSGIDGLDTVLNGGFFKGGIYLIQGTPGTGKTTLANQLCFHRIGQGDRALYFTLLAEYHARMVQYIGGMSFFDHSRLPDQMSYISGFKVMRDEGLPALLTMIRREILARKVSVLIVDGLVAARRVASSYQSFNEFLHDLQGLAVSTGCSVFLVASGDRDTQANPEHTQVDGILELSDQTCGWSNVRALQVTKIRGTNYLRGMHPYKITNDGIQVFPRIEALLASSSMTDSTSGERSSSGNAQLDAMLGGGLPANSPTMLAGPSGIGKTTFGLHFLAGCTREEPGLLMGFYETPVRIVAKAQQVCQHLLPLLEKGIVEILWEPPTSDALDAYAHRLLAAIRRRGVRRLFLDGLGAFQSAPGAEDRMKQFLPALTNELRKLGVTTVYSLEAGNIVGPPTPVEFGEVSVLAENLLLLRYVQVGAKLHRLVSILKVRDSDFDSLMHEFVLSAAGPVITPSTRSAEAIMRGQILHGELSAAELSPRVD